MSDEKPHQDTFHIRTVSFYHRATGILHERHLTLSDPSLLKRNTPPDHIAIDGRHDPHTKRVDVATGDVVDYESPLAAERESRQRRDTARAQIAALEVAQHRAVRELLLTIAPDSEAAKRLHSIDEAIAALRTQLK